MKFLKTFFKRINIFFTFNFLIVLSFEDIFNNPLLISESENPIPIKGKGGNYYIYSSGKLVTLNSNGEIQSIKSFPTFNAPYVWIADQSGNYYIFSSNAFYKVYIPNSYSVKEKPSIKFPTSSKFVGYIAESKNDGNTKSGCLCPILLNEKIIYGRSGSFNITFSFIKKEVAYSFQVGNTNIEDKMSCKKIESGQYLCSIVYGYIVHIYLFSHLSISSSKCQLKISLHSELNLFNRHTTAEIYDTNIITNKIICAKNLNTFEIECLELNITITKLNGVNSCSQTQEISTSDIIINFPTGSSSREGCIYKHFASEKLLCCGGTNAIKCSRMFENNTLIKTFDLDFPGENSKLTFFTDSTTYVSIIFLNTNSGSKIYKYFIFLPTCKDLNYTIIAYHSLNENKEEAEKINLNDLFIRKTNTEYYFEFESLPNNYGDLLVNNEKIIEGNNNKILLENDQSYILDFISTINNETPNFQIQYIISIEETYSCKCSIDLTILPCYDSCSKCSKDKYMSTNQSHNCIEGECKEGYYPSPFLVTNCFSEEEKELNWYLDNNTKRFSLCNDKCSSCFGPNTNNCLTCFDTDITSELNYLYNNECLNQCPEGTFAEKQKEGYYKCNSCFINCKTCNEAGNSTDMKCISCYENDIIYKNNCYKEYNNKEKTFYKAEGNSEITSCFQLFNYYIKENTYECISSMPSIGYFLVNSTTGLFSKCHSDCKTCSYNYNDISTNCDTCENSDYFLLEGNCISSCPEGYFIEISNGINICKKCYKNCMTCNQGEIYYELDKISNMNCLKCKKEIDSSDSNYLKESQIQIGGNCFPIKEYNEKKIIFDVSELKSGESEKTCLSYGKSIIYGEYQCISKPLNYYYVLNNEENTGVISKCHNNCKTCNNKIIDNNMNCLSCIDNYYKIVGTNNCYNESLISQGYYLHDNLFYPCEESCKTCSNSKTIINGIQSNNCLSCDFLTKGFYLVSDLNNCEPESFKEQGYYIGEDPYNPGIKKFYKCFISCSLCEKGLELSISTNRYIHNCLSCKDNFHHLKNDINPTNCYNEEEMIPQGYNLVRDFWQICHENCNNCTGKPDYDDHDNLISQNCLSCYGNLHFIFKTLDCSDNSILSKGYYFDDNDLMYHKCDIQCKTCEKYSSYTEPKCISCNEEFGYYTASNKPSSRCYNETTIDDQYILSSIENPLTGEIIKKWINCYRTCETCNNLGNELENKCIKCIFNYNFIYGTSNCINDDYAQENGYYFNTTYNKYVKCNIACKTCTSMATMDNTNCIKCNEEFGYYPIKGKYEDKCFNEETIGEGYFLNKHEETYGWEECYDNCAYCEYKGNSKQMGCISCKNNLINKEFNKPIYLKFSEGNCNIGCPNNLFLTKQFDCVPSCLNGTYEFSPNSTCLDSCPEKYEINSEHNKCIFSRFSGVISPNEFKDIIFQNISAFVDSSTVINASNFKAQIIAADEIDPIEQIKLGISGLDLGDCIEILKDKYNISDNEDLIVIEIETQEDKEKNKDLDRSKDCIDLGKNVKVSICDMDGNILNMSYCNNAITVMKYVGDVEDIDINTAMGYSEKGIDVFNTQDDFFNERCHHYDSDTDIILGDRRNDLFQNVSFCGDECLYSGMDYNLMIAKCSCDPRNIQDVDINLEIIDDIRKGITLNDLANSFKSELFSFNFDVIKCYNLVFDLNILKKNIGFFSNIIMIGLQIIFLIFFLVKRLKPIRNYMLVFEPFDPRIDPPNPPKLEQILKTEENNTRKVNFYNYLDLKSDDHKNLSKKEKDLHKSIFFSDFLNKKKLKKKEQENKNNDNNEDFLIVHYVNSEDSSSNNKNKSNKNQKKESEAFNSNNSDFNSDNSSGKSKWKTEKKMNKNFSNPKIYNMNNRGLNSYNIFSKETIVSENLKNKYQDDIHKQTLTLESNEISPRTIKFNELKDSGIFNKTKNESKNKILIYDEHNIREREAEKYESINNSKKDENDDYDSLDIYLNKKKKKKIMKDKNIKTLKHYIKNRNENRKLNIMTSNEALFSTKETKIKNVRDNNSVKYYPKNKIEGNCQSPEETRKAESVLIRKKKGKKAKKEKDEELGNMRLKYKKINYALTNEELNDLDFEEAFINDNRTFLRIFISYLLGEHIIFNTICTDAYLELRTIKLSFLIFGYEINFFLNSFFYTDQYISDTYHNDGVLDFFSSLPKSIYSFIVTLVISNLLRMLSNSKKQLNKIIKEREDKREYLKAMENELNKLKKKLVCYFIIVFILGIFFSYYVSAFCAVYQNSQTFWLYGCLESLAMDFITPFIICIVLSILRYIGLKKKSKCVYNSAKYLGILI